MTFVDGMVFLVVDVFINFATLMVNTVKVVFNVAFMSTAFSLLFPSIPLFSDIKHALIEAAAFAMPTIYTIRSIMQWFFDLFNSADTFFSELDFAYRWRNETNCGGAIAWMQFFAVLIFMVLIGIIMITDIMFILTISSHKIKLRFKNKLIKAIVGGILEVFSTVLFYLVQVLAFVGYQLALDGANFGEDKDYACGSGDETARDVARIATIIALIPFFAVGGWIFVGGKQLMEYANKANNGLAKLIILLLGAAKHLVCLTLGIWDIESLNNAKVLEKAEKYDDDPNDDDSQQEKVIAVIAKTRGLFWIIIPSTVFLTKICETMNDTIIFGNLKYNDPFAKRLILWIFNTSQIVLSILIIFVPEVGVAIALITTIVGKFVTGIIAGIIKAIGLIGVSKENGKFTFSVEMAAVGQTA